MSLYSKTKGLTVGATKLAVSVANPTIGVGIAAHETYKGVQRYRETSKVQAHNKELREMGYDVEEERFAKTKNVLLGGAAGVLGLDSLLNDDD